MSSYPEGELGLPYQFVWDANFIRGVELRWRWMCVSSTLRSDWRPAGVKSAAAVFSSVSACEAHLNALAHEFGLIGLRERAEISDEIFITRKMLSSCCSGAYSCSVMLPLRFNFHIHSNQENDNKYIIVSICVDHIYMVIAASSVLVSISAPLDCGGVKNRVTAWKSTLNVIVNSSTECMSIQL